MADQRTQSAASHSRWFLLYHFVALPALLVSTIYLIWEGVQDPSLPAVMTILFAVGVTLLSFTVRTMVTTVQDRVIRLEETLRLQRLLPPNLHGDLDHITPDQMVAIRFASDPEVPDLVRKVLAKELVSQKEIKAAIRNWRADWFRA